MDAYKVLHINRYENSGRTPLEEDKYIKDRAESMMKEIGKEIDEEKKRGRDKHKLQILYKMHDDIYKAYQCLRDEDLRHEYNMKLKYDKSKLFSENCIIGNPTLEIRSDYEKIKAQPIKDNLSIKEIGRLNYRWFSGVYDYLNCYEVTIVNEKGETEKYNVFSDIVWNKYSEEPEYRYFVKNTLLSPENIKNCCKYTSGYLGMPVKKDGKYKLDYCKEHVTATRKNEIREQILKDIVSKAEESEER